MVATKVAKLGAELLNLGKTKLTKKLKEADEKIENLLDKKKGTSKKTTEKEKKQLQKNIDANKGKVTQIKKRISNLKKKQTKPKVETSTKLAPKEQIEKFKKQQQSLKKSKVTKPKAKQTQVTKAKQNRAKKQSKSKAKTGFVLQGKVVDKTPKLPILRRERKDLTVINKPKNKSKSFGSSGQKTKTDVNKLVNMKGANVFSKAPSKTKTGNIFSRNKKKLAALAVASTLPFAIDTEDSKVKSKNMTNTKAVKKQKSLKNIKSRDIKTYKTKSLKEKKRTNITAGGSTGFGPKGNIFAKNEKDRKRLMDLYGGTGSAAYKAAVKGTQGNLSKKKLSEGTKDKTIGSNKDAMNDFRKKVKLFKKYGVYKNKFHNDGYKDSGGHINSKKPSDKKRADIYTGRTIRNKKNPSIGKTMRKNTKLKKNEIGVKTGGDLKSLKDLPDKSVNPGIHMLPAKAKINMGFKPMFGGGLVASFYDKAEKSEKHKGNMNVARQVKGYGKAKKKT